METWKEVPGFEGYYTVSDLGRVKAVERIYYSGYYGSVKKCNPERIMAGFINKKNGYRYVGLCKDGSACHRTVHSLVALAFLIKPQSAQCVNHIDGDKANNALKNLEYATFKENVRHAFKNGLMRGTMTGKFGSEHNRSKGYIPKAK